MRIITNELYFRRAFSSAPPANTGGMAIAAKQLRYYAEQHFSPARAIVASAPRIRAMAISAGRQAALLYGDAPHRAARRAADRAIFAFMTMHAMHELGGYWLPLYFSADLFHMLVTGKMSPS